MTSSIRWIERGALAICAIAVLLLMLVGAWDIVSGQVLGFFLAFKVELSGALLASCIFLACGPVQRNGEHIRVDLFEPRFGPRFLAVRDLLSMLCGLLMIGLISYGLWQQAIKSIQILEVSADTSGFAIWPWKLACAVGASLCTLLMLGQLATCLGRIAGLFRKDAP
ncbi:MAG: TRAP transporter small permease subunit [Comamonadaceae bacterium]|nr:MAG: TRAP transporter small permease subunit [Comamonadaceae bacterium]